MTTGAGAVIYVWYCIVGALTSHIVLAKWHVAYDPCFSEGWLVQLTRQQTEESLKINYTSFHLQAWLFS
jgi:hypothetical protein